MTDVGGIGGGKLEGPLDDGFSPKVRAFPIPVISPNDERLPRLGSDGLALVG